VGFGLYKNRYRGSNTGPQPDPFMALGSGLMSSQNRSKLNAWRI